MATAAYQVPVKPAKHGLEEHQKEPIRKIRITLSSTKVKNVEKVCSDLIQRAKEQKDSIKTKGPVRMPTKTLRITTRKAPCGEGTNTWDRFEMRIHKRVIDIFTTPGTVRKITKIDMLPGVEVEVTIGDI
ncbi:40S ribosomal protein S20-1-like [Argentina anserina]|uniref:40S ribosomal protein S20-1-like n=1 Tax=Argentina anserina TaxID=57926 RepID=UPI00217692A2|nr:40S ribosomal protein S20-1-like [Potentilla anserina]